MTPEQSARRRHAGRTSRVARAGLVLAVIAVSASVGVGTWLLGSGADAARRVEPPPVLSGVTKSQPPLSIAPPPKDEPERASRSTTVRKAAKKVSQKSVATAH